MKILIHPDIFYNEQSGAVAARTAGRIIASLGHEVGVFTHDEETRIDFDCKYFKRIRYKGTAHFLTKLYRRSFEKTLNEFKPDFIFFIGGVVNTPTVYLKEARLRGIKTAFLILVQDFYCIRMHAALNDNSCTKCLTGTNLNSLFNNCLEKGRNPFLFFISYQLKQKLFVPELKKLNYVLGSSDEQLSFYEKIGIEKNRCFKIPLFFDRDRIKTNCQDNQDYFVFIAQNRPEKGIHLFPQILEHIRKDVKIKVLFYSEYEAGAFLKKYPLVERFVAKGNVDILPGSTMQTGAVEIIAKSRGVLNLSIWATTTEFVYLEILGLAKTMICFDVGIHKETIQHRINGCVVKSGDFFSFANELSFLKDNPDKAATIGSNGLKLFKELTDEDMFKNKLKELFQ